MKTDYQEISQFSTHWLRFDSANLKFYGTPTVKDTGNFTVKLTFNNGIKENFDTFEIQI